LAETASVAKTLVTVVTGFLGSGKTTLLSRALAGPSVGNTVVFVNEFGEVGLDHHLLRRVEERTVLLGGGCVCCATREDLVEGLLDLLGSDPLPNRVVVETTGLADPAPILYTIFTHPVLQHHFAVERVVCTVDAVNGAWHLDHNPESARQVAAADAVFLTKTDLVGPGETQSLLARLRRANPSAEIQVAPFGESPVNGVFGVGETGALRLTGEGFPPLADHATTKAHSEALGFDGPLDWAAFGVWLSMLLHARGEGVLRVKGLLDIGGPGPVLLNGVQHVLHPPEHLPRWPDGDRRSRIVFITRGTGPGEIRASLGAFARLLGARPVPLIRRASV